LALCLEAPHPNKKIDENAKLVNQTAVLVDLEFTFLPPSKILLE